MKARYVNVFLLVLLLAVGAGWWYDRRCDPTLPTRDCETEVAVRSTLAVAMNCNLIYSQLDEFSAEEFNRRRDRQLISNVLLLWQYRDDMVDRVLVAEKDHSVHHAERDALLAITGRALHLLRATSPESFNDKLSEASLIDELKSIGQDATGALRLDFAEHLRICLDLHEYKQLAASGDRSFDEAVQMAKVALRLYRAGEVRDVELMGAERDLENAPRALSQEEAELLEEIRTSLDS